MPTQNQIDLFDSVIESGVTDIETILRCGNFIFYDDRKIFELSLEVLDENKLIRYVKTACGSRSFCLVKDSNEKNYLCFQKYCSCRSFVDLVKKNNRFNFNNEIFSVEICKHLLAIKIAKALNLLEVEVRMKYIFFLI